LAFPNSQALSIKSSLQLIIMPQTFVLSKRKPKHLAFNALRPKNAASKRNRAPPAAEWDRQKPNIKQLLLVEKKPLKEVMQILQEEHSFHAEYGFRLHVGRMTSGS